jgi:flagellar FliJ protein
MARFRFRLQSVLDVRARVQDERQRELALSQRDLSDAAAALADLNDAREEQRGALTREHHRFDVEALRATYAHLAYLDRAIEDQAVRVAACRDEADRAQARLIAANTEKKVLETLRTRRYEAFNAQATVAEQQESDEQNARRFGRESTSRENKHE